ncbi:glycosyltransferase family 4 protein, partial [Candidatus Uhrbacteria bacterium]|nr:glycosyltransferase family 4 protein [Candidatus Uhrbacteria bacterium]
MRILIDCRCLQKPAPRSGVGVLTEGMLRALLAADSTNEYFLFANGFVDPRRYLPTFGAPNVRWIIRRIPNKILNGAWSLGLHAWRFPKVDILLVPNPNFLPTLPRDIPLVLVVHDLSFEHFRDCFTPKQRLLYRLMHPRKLLHRADAIIAVSETTKRDVMETYGIPEEKVHVVYPGIEHPNLRMDPNAPNGEEFVAFGSGIRSIRMFPDPYILTLSAIEPRKNIDGLIAAFERLTPLHLYTSTPPLHLIIAGIPGSATPAIRRQIARSPARDRIHLLGPVSESEKHALLARASCFVY